MTTNSEHKILVSSFGFLIETLKENNLILESGKIDEKAFKKLREEDKEYSKWWRKLQKVYRQLRATTINNVPIEVSADVDTAIKKMGKFDRDYIPLLVSFELLSKLKDNNPAIADKKMLNIAYDLYEEAISVLRDVYTPTTIRDSKIFAVAIYEYATLGKIVPLKIKIEHKPSWAKGRK